MSKIKKPYIVGVAGNAGVGKDTLARILKSKFTHHGLQSEIFSLAFQLRGETDKILRKFNLNVWTQNREEKSVFRNFLVEYAELARRKSSGQYFWGKLDKMFKNSYWKDLDIALISDVRFCEYEKDEVWWVKKNGMLVLVDAYKDCAKILPANKKEQHNYPKLKENCDFRLVWNHEGLSDEDIYSKNRTKIDEIVNTCIEKVNV